MCSTGGTAWGKPDASPLGAKASSGASASHGGLKPFIQKQKEEGFGYSERGNDRYVPGLRLFTYKAISI
jgi:hypothetical protein